MMSCVVSLLIFLAFYSPVFGQELKGEILVFDDKDKAASYALSSLWTYVSPESKKAEYIKTKAIVESLWPSFCERYSNCANIPKPEIIISYSSGSSTFGMLHEGKVRQTNVIIVPWELVDRTYEDLEFVLAHEMVHYFEKHAETQNLKDEITKIHRQAFGDCFEYNYPLENVKDDLISLMDLMEQIGEKPYMVSPYRGIPLDGILGNLLSTMILKTQHLGEECPTLYASYRILQNRIRNGNYLHNADSKVRSFRENAQKCFEKYDGNLLKEVLQGTTLTSGIKDEEEMKKFLEIINTDGPELNRLITLRDQRFITYSALSRKLSAPQLRFQTEEDIADIEAIKILLRSGRRDIKKHLNYLLVELSTTEQIRCKDDLAKGREPDYGPLNRPHHSECWRIWRAIQIENEFLGKKNKETKGDKTDQETGGQNSQ